MAKTFTYFLLQEQLVFSINYDGIRRHIHCNMYFRSKNVWTNGMIMSNQCLHAVYVMWVDYWTNHFESFNWRICGLLREINWKCLSTHVNTTVTHCTYCHASMFFFVWNGNVSQTLQKILTFYVALHICWTKYTQEGFNKLHHPSCGARWLHLNPFWPLLVFPAKGKLQCFSIKMYCQMSVGTPSLCSMFLQSDNCNTKLIKQNSFKITEVIAKLW